ncbi:MAG TPA: efflux transporter outer membrane subunit [Methylomirabilota bacterium]|nr:efflux transporter outer membrane subunit [Methylomirabilota bacterium]
MRLGWKKSAPVKPAHGPSLGSAGAAAGTAALLLAVSIAAANAAVGPEYQRPAFDAAGQYKATNELGAWKEAKPMDNLPKGPWWEVFNDPTLNDLQQRATTANQQVKAAAARVEQARATARAARGEFLPTLDFNPGWRRERFSPNQEPSFGNITANTFRVPLDLSYEIDLWGRVRRGFEAARADAAAGVAAFHSALLLLQADVAQNYFSLRALDAELASMQASVDLRKELVRLVRSRFEGGIGNELDTARAETELATAQAESAALQRRRVELENAIAILIGENPSVFRLPATSATNWAAYVPLAPPGLPADLLERRPDIGEAERQLAAANARIGVAKGAFFPSIRLTGSAGYLSGELDNLFNWDSRVWSIGPSVSLPIFAGGRNRANLRRSRAAYEEAVAVYRQRVLVAFAEVENALSGLHFLSIQSEAQERALSNARRAADLARQRYSAGIVSYLEVVDANRAALQTSRGSAQLAGQRLIASVQLIKALGGGWNSEVLTGHQQKPL